MFVVRFMFCSMFFPLYVFADDTKILFSGNSLPSDLPNNGKGLNGANFLALHKVGEGYFLSEAKIIYISHDDDNGNVSSNIKNAIIYIRSRNIKSGEVPIATVDGSNQNIKVSLLRVSGKKIKISLGNRLYVIYEGKKGLIMTGRDGKSIISPGGSGLFNTGFFIIWAGDLDRDGKLDLIIHSQDVEEKSGMSCLLLSSIATKPQLVSEAACQLYSG